MWYSARKSSPDSVLQALLRPCLLCPQYLVQDWLLVKDGGRANGRAEVGWVES